MENRAVKFGRIGLAHRTEIARVLGSKWESTSPGASVSHGHQKQLWHDDGTSIQFAQARYDDHLFVALGNELPLAMAHEGIWSVERYDDHFTLTSPEACTVGPFRWQADVQQRLEVFGLEIRPKRGQLHGYAHFADLEAGCIADAVDRLYWLEDTFWRINQGIAKYTADLWQRALEGVACPDELVESDEMVNPLAFFPDLPPRKLKSDYG